MTLITSLDQIPTKDPTANLIRVDVPEWGVDCYVLLGRMSGIEYQQYQDFIAKESNYGVPKCRHAALIAACMRNDQGRPVLSPGVSEPLARLDEAVLMRLWFACMKHNCLDDEAFEDLKKNYEATHSNGSATDSPAT